MKKDEYSNLCFKRNGIQLPLGNSIFFYSLKATWWDVRPWISWKLQSEAVN
jgi:hypothetical protein